MKAVVTITKSFDYGKQFSKTYEDGDFKKFFEDEGEYLDRLCGITEKRGKNGDKFTVTYEVNVTK